MAELSKAELKRKLKEKAGLVYKHHVLLCLGPNCQPEVGAKTQRALGKCLTQLEVRQHCHLTAVQCFRLCRSGPIAVVYPEGTWYCGVTPAVGERIVREHLVAGNPVEEFVFARVPLKAAASMLQSSSVEANKMADEQLKKGDKVEWDSSGGHSTGKVVEKITETTKIKGHTAKASPEEPQYKVESDKSGKTAIHKPEELKKST